MGISPIFRSRLARPQAPVGFEIGVNNWTYPLFLRQFRIRNLTPGESPNSKPDPLGFFLAIRRPLHVGQRERGLRLGNALQPD